MNQYKQISLDSIFRSGTGQLQQQVKLVQRPCKKPLIVKSEKVLIVNTKSGGHAFVGIHLAKQLVSSGHKVMLVNDGDKEKLTKSNPFKQYESLNGQGIDISFSSPAKPSEFPSQDFDVVIDNNGKDLDTCKPLIDHFNGKIKQHIFVASAGAYKGSTMEPLLVEGDERKSSAGHVEVENYLSSQKIAHTVIQPLYMYGPYTAKFYEGYFLDRILRDRPVLIPYPGIQLTSLTHVEDVAQLISKCIGNKNAINQHFNACTDRYITFNGVVNILASILNKSPNIKYYDPSKLQIQKGWGVPFRNGHFIASCDKAKSLLGYKPQHTFDNDAKQLVEFYANSKMHEKADFSFDDVVLEQQA